MTNRNTLHINHLEAFKVWLTRRVIAYRPGKGAYQVLQVVDTNGCWSVIYKRLDMPEHYTVPDILMCYVKSFLREVESIKEKFDVTQKTMRISSLEELLGELYQVLGAHNVKQEVMDQVRAALNEESLPYETLLPYTPE